MRRTGEGVRRKGEGREKDGRRTEEGMKKDGRKTV